MGKTDPETPCRKCGHAYKHHCIPPVRGNDDWDPGTFGVLLHCMPPYPSKGSSCGCDGFEPREDEEKSA